MKEQIMKKVFLSVLILCTAIFHLSAEESDWFAEKFPEKLITSSGKEVNTSEALKGKIVLVYFSASWCGPCKAFTPQLIKFYKKTAKKEKLEIVLAGFDKTEDAMKKYMKKYSMPWLAVPFGDDSISKLKREAKVNGIPHLIVYDCEGKMLSSNARWDVSVLGTAAVSAWKDQEYKPKTIQDFQEKNKKKSKKSKKSRKSGKKQKK